MTSEDYKEQGYWEENTTMGSFLDTVVAEGGNRLAQVQDDFRLTYDDLYSVVCEVQQGLLSLGAAPGSVVTFQLPNWWECQAVYFATSRIDCVSNPVPANYRAREVGFILDQAKPAVVFIPHRFRGFDFVEMMAQLLESRDRRPTIVVVRPEGLLPPGFLAFDDLRQSPGENATVDMAAPDHPHLLCYTSGTTADPKGVLHNHYTLVYDARSMVRWFELSQADRIFMPMPLTHVAGLLWGLHLPVVIGSPLVTLERWSAEKAVDLIEAEGCTWSMGSTPFLYGLADEYGRRGAHSSLSMFVCGGADVPPELVRRARATMGGDVVRLYGSSEFPSGSSGRPGVDEYVAADTDGFPIPPAVCAVDGAGVDGVGELLVKGPELFMGYLDSSLNESAFTADGYFRTGDLATLNEDGTLTIQGRKKDIIVRGGENISAKEIEDLIFEHPKVKDIAVVGIPDESMGERACAVAVLSEGEELSLEELSEYLTTTGIAKQKFPESLVTVDSLPRTTSGKIQKHVIRAEISKGSD